MKLNQLDSTAAQPVAGRSSSAKRNFLLLCDYNTNTAGTILDHIFGLRDYSRQNIVVVPFLGDVPEFVDLEGFDGIIVHYSLIVSNDNYVCPALRKRIRNFKGLKIVFIQDDYRWINDTVNALAYMKVNAIFGLAPEEAMDEVYSAAKLPDVRRETMLAGYVPEHLTKLRVSDFEDRRLDVAYRARKLPAWIGAHGQEKWLIADRFRRDAERYHLKTDISYLEEDRIYGHEWIRFLCRTKAVLGTESGSSVCDFTGDIQRNVEAHVEREPDAPFEHLSELYFKNVDGEIPMKIISPRCFEAAALRTLMILYEGNYSGILKPWRHFVPLARDHSNMDEVVRVLREPSAATAIIDTAYREIALNPRYSFKAMVERMDDVIDELFVPETHAAFPPDAGQFRTLVLELDRKQRIFRRQYRLAKLITIFGESFVSLLPAPWRKPVLSFFRSVNYFVPNSRYTLRALRYDIIRHSAATASTFLSLFPAPLQARAKDNLRRIWYSVRGQELHSASKMKSEPVDSPVDRPRAQGH